MTFAFPAMLWAFAALSVPIIIHLFDFQRPKKVVFSDIRFLKEVNQATKNARQLKNLLVLLCRLLAMGFLVLAFAQPLWKKDVAGGATATQEAIIVVDNSYSTEASEGGNTVLDLSLQAAEKVVKSFPASTRFRFITNQFHNRERFFENRQKTLESIAETGYSPRSRTADELAQFVNASQEGKGAKVYWFSDFQSSTLGNLQSIATDSSRNWKIIPMGIAEVSNAYIDSVWVSNPAIRARENNFVEFTASHSGSRKDLEVTVKLFVGNTQTGATTLNIPPGGQVKSKIAFNLPDNQPYNCRLTCNDEPIRFDNNFFFMLKPAPKVQITLIKQGKQPYLEAAFTNKDLFDFQSFEVGNIDFERLKRSDLLIASGISGANPGLQDAIAAQLQSGGSVWLLPGNRSGMGFWNSITASASGLSGRWLNIDSASGPTQSIKPPDTRDPFFESVFEKLPENAYMPFAIPVIAPSYKGRAILSLGTGEPILSSYFAGEGVIYTLNTLLEEKTSNLGRNALFVPICYKIAFSSLRKSDRIYYTFGQKSINWRTELSGKTNVYALKNDEGNWIPRQVFSNANVQMELPSALTAAGFYDVMVNDLKEGTLAINYSQAESNLDVLSGEVLLRKFEGAAHVEVLTDEDPSTVADEILAETVGYPLWAQCLWLALICLLAEVLFVRFLPTGNTVQV